MGSHMHRNGKHISIIYALVNSGTLGCLGRKTDKKDLCSYPDDVVHCVDVTVANVHPDGSDGKSIVLP